MRRQRSRDIRSDAELVWAAQSGDLAAFDDLVRRYQDLVYWLAFALTRSSSESEDLTQSTFVVAWRRISDLKEPALIRSWLCGVARRLILNLDRSKRRSAAAGLLSRVVDAEPPSTEPSPLDQAIGRQQAEMVRRALGQIPEMYRLPLVLFYADQMSVEEIARALDISRKNASVRLARGRRLLHRDVLALVESGTGKAVLGDRFPSIVIAAIMSSTPGRPEARRVDKALGWKGAALVWLPSLVAIGLVADRWTAPPTRRPIAHADLGRARAAVPIGSSWLQPSSRLKAEDIGRPQAPPAAGWERLTEPAALGASPILDLDFEDGVQSPSYVDGEITSGPARPGNKHCLIATMHAQNEGGADTEVLASVEIRNASTDLFRYREDLLLSFDYWLETGARPLRLALYDPDQQRWYVLHSRSVVAGMWAHMEMKLGDAVEGGNAQDNSRPIRPGDRVSQINIDAHWSYDQAFYVDNVRIRTRGR